MHGLILAKIVQPSEKCQITDLYFSYIHPSTITLCKNLHDHQLCIFTPFIFTRNQQLIKVKQEDHIPSIPTVGLAFFLARACQHKTSKIGTTILDFPSSRYAFYKMETNLKAVIQLNLILLEKYPTQQVSYFYQIVHFMKNPTKFGSLNLDTPIISYEFYKFATKSGKTTKEKHQKLV